MQLVNQFVFLINMWWNTLDALLTLNYAAHIARRSRDNSVEDSHSTVVSYLQCDPDHRATSVRQPAGVNTFISLSVNSRSVDD